MASLLERENEQLTEQNTGLQAQTERQSERISDLEFLNENITADNTVLQNEKTDLQSPGLSR